MDWVAVVASATAAAAAAKAASVAAALQEKSHIRLAEAAQVR